MIPAEDLRGQRSATRLRRLPFTFVEPFLTKLEVAAQSLEVVLLFFVGLLGLGQFLVDPVAELFEATCQRYWLEPRIIRVFDDLGVLTGMEAHTAHRAG